MKNIKLRRVLFPIAGFLIMCLYLFPIYWMIISSMKTTTEIFAVPPTFFPNEITFESYATIFSPQNQFQKYILNSIIISVSTMLLTILLCTPAAYGLARKKVKCVGILIAFVLIIQMFPSSMLSLPLFTLFSQLHLTDSYISVILANMTISMPFAIVVLRTFFISLPKDLESAALVDGCTVWGTFLRIMVPISKTGIMTCAAFSFVFAWGEFMYSLILLNDQKYWPITLGIRQFDGQYGTQWGEMMAVAVVCSLPVILIFLFAQKYIVSGVTAGSVKG
jgi:multiple sugar transport system permease protein